MSDSKTAVIALLRELADRLEALPQHKYEDVISGKMEVVLRVGRSKARKSAADSRDKLPAPRAAEIADSLRGLETREEGIDRTTLFEPVHVLVRGSC